MAHFRFVDDSFLSTQLIVCRVNTRRGAYHVNESNTENRLAMITRREIHSVKIT